MGVLETLAECLTLGKCSINVSCHSNDRCGQVTLMAILQGGSCYLHITDVENEVKR